MRILLAAAAAFLGATAFSPQSDCGHEFFRGQAPANIASRFAGHATQLCFTDYAVLTSADTRTPLWSAEHVTREDVSAAHALTRVDRFHAESALPADARAEISDYTRSGFDRGHMAPSGDMPSDTAQSESFSLANMAPQLPSLNRGLWEEIESSVRALAVRDGDVFVVTGPMFNAGAPMLLNNRIQIPAAFYKAIYDPRTGLAGAYVAWNAPGDRMTTVSIARLRGALGFDPFPALGEDVKARTMALPAPSRRAGGVS